jgi:hypothetical protein
VGPGSSFPFPASRGFAQRWPSAQRFVGGGQSAQVFVGRDSIHALPEGGADVNDSNEIWCVVANITREPHLEGEERRFRLGTKHFSPGGKVYILPITWGNGGERLRVLGRHRGSHRFAQAVIPARLLTNFRVKQIFNPMVASLLDGSWGATGQSRAKCEEIAKSLSDRYGFGPASVEDAFGD